MNKLSGKKLLILGGSALSGEIVSSAHRLGVKAYVTDWYTDSQSPAKKIADKAFMVSTADVEAVVDLIHQENIDGVLTGFTDSTLTYYQQICQKAYLPCYASAKQIDICTNKIKFKEFCRNYQIPVVEEIDIVDIGMENESIEYPIIVKPADNSGARGISICYNKEEFEIAYDTAMSFSENKSVLVERYIQAEEATIFYVIDDGEPYLTVIGDRHMGAQQEGFIPLPAAYTFPSRYLEWYEKHLNDKVIAMFKAMGLKNGMIFIQSCVEEGEFVFYEIGYRLTGSLEYKLLEKICGYNPMEMMIEFALTGKMSSTNVKDRINPNLNILACNITYSVKPGKIKSILGVNEILSLPGVIDVFPSYQAGDEIPTTAKGTLQQVVLRAFVTAKTFEELMAIINKSHSRLKVIADDGSDMLLSKFATGEFNR